MDKLKEKTVLMISQNRRLMRILRIIQELGLEQGCLCAGTIRNAIWDMLINNQKPVIHDVDVIFFDTNQNESKNRKYERTLSKKFPNYQWQVRNQVYMNSRASQNPYKST